MKTIIEGGLIVDGSGKEPFAGDILIIGGVIAAVGSIQGPVDDAVFIQAEGRCVTPGFIDIHRHGDYAVFKDGFGGIELAQGITTMVTGACGLTPYPAVPEMADCFAPILGEKPFDIPTFAAYRAALTGQPLPINVGGMLGSCSLRAAVKGMADRSAFTQGEMAAAKQIAEEAAADGALGISLGIMYQPEVFSTVDEMAEIAKAAPVLTAHIRGEGGSLTASVQEAIQIARQADVPLEISHFKCCGVENWGRGIYQAIEIIEQARQSHDITVDFYPYHGGASTLLSLLPPDYPREAWGDAALLKAALTKTYQGWDNYIASLGFERIILTNLRQPEHAVYNGKSIAAAADGHCPYTLFSGVLSGEGGRAGVIVMSMSPEDVDTVAKLPYASVISDALYPSDTQTAHPRLFSSFPKIIRDYVIERRVLALPEAIRKMTALPAERLHIPNRGRVKPGYAADINIFAPGEIKDRSDFSRSGLLAEGMAYVLVNGQLAWENGQAIGNHGRFI